MCDSGKNQSPIDLSSQASSKGYFDNGDDYQPTIDFNGKYTNDMETVTMAEHTIVTSVSSGGFAKMNQDGSEDEFVAVQFHYHAPSEHTIDG